MMQIHTSSQLTLKKVYTRAALKQQFSIIDSTINTGVFRPKGHHWHWFS